MSQTIRTTKKFVSSDKFLDLFRNGARVDGLNYGGAKNGPFWTKNNPPSLFFEGGTPPH